MGAMLCVSKMQKLMGSKFNILTGIFFLFILSTVCQAAGICVKDLSCTYSTSPSFSWKIQTDRQDVTQIAYRIQVAKNRKNLLKGNLLSDTGMVYSAEQIGISVSLQTSEFRLFWRIKVLTNKGESDWSNPAYFCAIEENAGTCFDQAKWISRPWDEKHILPLFRKQFNLAQNAKKIDYAIAHICGLGCSELYVNGKRPDDRYLDPAQSNYETYGLFSTIDITDQLQNGNNCIGVMLGDGWYNQDKVWGGIGRYGDPLLILQVTIHFDDGKIQYIATDDSWEWIEGPILSSNIYAGEVYDARKEIKNWCIPSEDKDSGIHWQKAILVENVPAGLRPQNVQPMRPIETRTATKIFKSKEGNWIFDFGENITGFPRITVKQPFGTHLVMEMAECLDEQNEMDFRSTGVFATEVVQTDEYICKGSGVESWQPHFTYHGFRYLQLSGQQGDPDPSWITAYTMHSDVPRQGKFSCSNEQLNHLHKLAMRTVLGNIQGLPTDCPHRERCGWLGDTHAYVKMADINLGMKNFWLKYLEDIRSTSAHTTENDLFHNLGNTNFYFGPKPTDLPYMIAPGHRLCGVASPDWGTAVVQIPWYLYVYYGDKESLTKYYNFMKTWCDYLTSRVDNGLIRTGLGDWCPPGEIVCPIPFSSTAFHYLDLQIMEKAAKILGKEEDEKYFRDQMPPIKTAIIREFYNPNEKTFGSMTANAMALDLGLYPDGDANLVSDAIVKESQEKWNNFMNCGIFGLARLGSALSEFGNEEYAFKLFTKQGNPSFAAMWDKWDATTLWEALPISMDTPDPIPSKNHPMQAGFDAWFYESVAGIRPDVEQPGFKHIIFKPTLCQYLDNAEATINTVYGLTSIKWKKKKGNLCLDLVVPANTSATLYLPDFVQDIQKEKFLTSGKHHLVFRIN